MKDRKEVLDDLEVIIRCANRDFWRMHRWADGSITIKSGEDQSGSTYVPKEVVAGGEGDFIDWLSRRRFAPEIVSEIAELLYPVTPLESTREVDNCDK